MNASKTKAVIFGSRHRVGSDACVSAEKIVVDDCIIPYVESVEYLGVIIDNVLAWEDQLFGRRLEFLDVALRRGDIRQDYLRLSRANSNMYDRSFLVHGIRIWNSLPADLTSLDNLNLFKNACFAYFLENDN
ncbi:Protein of unknown function [Cotesia congregata]|uniref:Uncharacterized protein n=1 Tax=Cotesia congregata TaxID=51543 RepID=A0A8J2HHM0_COTCN|nr:Protein of unknown function [Cotesia congregata]